MKLQQLREAIEGLPTSSDPYEPSMRPELDKPLSSEPSDLDQKSKLGLPDELPDGLPKEDLSPKPTGPIWDPMELPNKQDLGFRRNDGFMLRARRLESVPNKWIAQLWIKDKVLDNGSLFIPKEEDPALYLQEMTNYMLDTGSFRYQQAGMEEPSEPFEEPQSLGPPPEELKEPGVEKEIGLSDENFEFEEEA